MASIQDLKNLKGSKTERKRLWELCSTGKLKYVQGVEIIRAWGKKEVKDTGSAKEEFIAAFSTKDNKDEILREAETIFEKQNK